MLSRPSLELAPEALSRFLALTAEREDRVRAEPFGDVELSVAALFGDDDNDE